MWTRSYDGPAADSGFFTDYAISVAIDSAGSVVVGGVELVGPTDIDAWVRKYNADGDTLWTVSPEVSDASTEFANGIAIDSNDYVLVAGGSSPGDAWLVKYTP
jgi:hypothetical protein